MKLRILPILCTSLLPSFSNATVVSLAVRLLSACATFATLVFAGGGTRAAPRPSRRAHLLVHFTGESARGKQIYFSVSEDGLHWTDLNDSEPVLVSARRQRRARSRDVRSPDGKKFYLLATDLRIANGKGWGAARVHGSTSLVFWESTDLVNWSAPWMVDVASAIPEAGCAWAPEAIYDESTGDYFVYWTTMSPRNGVTRGPHLLRPHQGLPLLHAARALHRAQRPRRHHRHADHRGEGAEVPLLSRLARHPAHDRRRRFPHRHGSDRRHCPPRLHRPTGRGPGILPVQP